MQLFQTLSTSFHDFQIHLMRVFRNRVASYSPSLPFAFYSRMKTNAFTDKNPFPSNAFDIRSHWKSVFVAAASYLQSIAVQSQMVSAYVFAYLLVENSHDFVLFHIKLMALLCAWI